MLCTGTPYSVHLRWKFSRSDRGAVSQPAIRRQLASQSVSQSAVSQSVSSQSAVSQPASQPAVQIDRCKYPQVTGRGNDNSGLKELQGQGGNRYYVTHADLAKAPNQTAGSRSM